MLTLVITPQLCRSAAEVASLHYDFANPAHYEYLIDEDALVIGPDGVIARLVTNCLDAALVRDTASHFIKVHGDGSSRGSIAGKNSMMARERSDGTFGHTTAIPRSIVRQMVANNEFTDFLGWMDKSKYGDRFPDCRQTGWSMADPEIHKAAYPFVREVARVYREELPDHWQAQVEFMKNVGQKWRFDDTYTTVTVNRNKRTTYHCDGDDFRGDMGNLVVLEGGETGALVMPRFRVAFLPRPTDVLLMNVHEMHGNLPFTGERLTAVLYARERIDECG